MNLTLFFTVLSIGIGYMLYDMFRKSKLNNNKATESVNNRLKINYTQECAVLNELRKQKMQSVLPKTLSINLYEGVTQLGKNDAENIKQMLIELKKTHRIFLLKKKDHQYSPLFCLAAQTLGQDYIIPYHSVEGAIAILRQLSCGIHLEANQQVFHKIKQYVHKIWYVGNDSDEQALRQFSSELQMLYFLGNLRKNEE